MFTESKTNTTRFNHNGETFHDIFQRCPNNSHHSRSSKIEVTGVLVPLDRVVAGRSYKFKLDSDSKEYTLSLSKILEIIAKKIEWEDVTVKGWLDLHTNIIEVEKMSINQSNDSIRPLPSDDLYFDAEFYQKTIARRGKLEPAPDYMAS